jgi:hypothetical protein
MQHMKILNVKESKIANEKPKVLLWLYTIFLIFIDLFIWTLPPNLLDDCFALNAAVIQSGDPKNLYFNVTWAAPYDSIALCEAISRDPTIRTITIKNVQFLRAEHTC